MFSLFLREIIQIFLLLHKVVKVIFCCCRKHAFVDVLSDMDLTKALALNGETLLGKPMQIAKAKIKSEDKVKENAPELKKQGKHHKIICLNLCCICSVT